MSPDQWHVGLTVGVVLANVLATLWLVRVARRRAGETPAGAGDTAARAHGVPASGDDEPAPGDADGGGSEDLIQCSTCGTDNERGYRYCRLCVSELGTGATLADASDGPMRGLSR